jgi:Tfp pilus assembly protein PilO
MAANQTNQASSPAKSLSLLAFLFLLIGVGGSYMTLTPMLLLAKQETENARAKHDGLTNDLAQLKNAIRAASDTEAALLGLGFSFDDVAHMFPETEDLPGLYLQMEGLIETAKLSGIENANYQVAAPIVDQSSGMVSIPITVTATGAYMPLLLFISNLELNIRPISISTLNFAQSIDKDAGKAGGKFNLSATASVRAKSLSAAHTATAGQ